MRYYVTSYRSKDVISNIGISEGTEIYDDLETYKEYCWKKMRDGYGCTDIFDNVCVLKRE